MAHLVENMLYVGAAPWHKLGVALDNPPAVAEAIRLAGLDWAVVLKDLQLAETGEAVDHKATVRATDGKILGVVGPRYRPLQNADAFAWFEPFLASGEASIHTAGSLAEGRRVWILAKINREPSVIAPGDEVEKFILLSNSHDGTLAVRVGFTPIRVVCHNTLSLAHGTEASKLIRIRHTESAKDTLAEVREVMNAANQTFEATADVYRQLARRPSCAADLRKYVKQVFELPAEDKDLSGKSRTLLDSIIRRHGEQADLMRELMAGDGVHRQATTAAEGSLLDSIIGNFEGGRGSDLPDARGSYWQAYNAVTEYLSHERGRSADSRLNGLWFGEGAAINQRALSTAVAMAS
jgi:phage/plasmid-like protein (TIGR03299 family)